MVVPATRLLYGGNIACIGTLNDAVKFAVYKPGRLADCTRMTAGVGSTGEDLKARMNSTHPEPATG